MMDRGRATGRMVDQRYLRDEQYRDSGNLRARMGLHGRFSVNPQGWHAWVFERIVLPSDGWLLELGCGPGDLWRANADRVPVDWHLTLTDYSPGMVREALARV